MAEKYTERSVVLLKREIEQLSGEIHTLFEQEALIREDIKAEKSNLAFQRKMLSSFEEGATTRIGDLLRRETSLKEKVTELTKNIEDARSVFVLIRSSMQSLTVPEKKYTLVTDVIDRLRSTLEGISGLAVQKGQDLEEVEAKRAEYERQIHELVAEKEDLEPRLEWLRSEIFLGNDKNGRMGQEYLKLQNKIAIIHAREQLLYGGRCPQCAQQK